MLDDGWPCGLVGKTIHKQNFCLSLVQMHAHTSKNALIMFHCFILHTWPKNFFSHQQKYGPISGFKSSDAPWCPSFRSLEKLFVCKDFLSLMRLDYIENHNLSRNGYLYLCSYQFFKCGPSSASLSFIFGTFL